MTYLPRRTQKNRSGYVDILHTDRGTEKNYLVYLKVPGMRLYIGAADTVKEALKMQEKAYEEYKEKYGLE